MLTAVSVARECSMIPTQSRAIVIKATFVSTAKMPRLSYHAVGETTDQIHLLRSNSMSGTYNNTIVCIFGYCMNYSAWNGFKQENGYNIIFRSLHVYLYYSTSIHVLVPGIPLHNKFYLCCTEPYRSEPESYQENLDPPLGGVYHLVVDGKSFDVIREHCPQVMERVSWIV